VSCAGLVPVVTLAQKCDLAMLADEHLWVPTDKGAHAGSKVSALVAGMLTDTGMPAITQPHKRTHISPQSIGASRLSTASTCAVVRASHGSCDSIPQRGVSRTAPTICMSIARPEPPGTCVQLLSDKPRPRSAAIDFWTSTGPP
jgi:hypothetical protein